MIDQVICPNESNILVKHWKRKRQRLLFDWFVNRRAQEISQFSLKLEPLLSCSVVNRKTVVFSSAMSHSTRKARLSLAAVDIFEPFLSIMSWRSCLYRDPRVLDSESS